MARQDIVDYLKKELAAGYPVAQLRQYLLSQGYSQKQIDEAIDSLYETPKAKSKLKLPKTNITPFLVLGVVVVVFIFGFVLLRMFLSQGPTEVSLPGENVSTSVIEQGGQAQPVQPAAPVQKEEVQQAQPEKQVITAPERGINLAVALERIDSLSLPESKSLCSQFSGSEKDRCLRKVALVHDDSASCDAVVDVKIRDDCYFNFAYLSEFSVCEKIQDVYLKESCRGLGTVQTYTLPENQTANQI